MVLDTSARSAAGAVVLIVIILAVYFIPTIVAFTRHHHQAGAVLAINFLLGWTLIGWAVALAMAMSAHRQPPVVIQQLVGNPVTTAPPGWYPDPEHPGQERRWEGTTWTHEFRQAGGGVTPLPPTV